MKTRIICTSVHKQNTLKIAEAIARELDATVLKPAECDTATILDYDLIGFGSGIYNGKHHESLFRLVEELQGVEGKKAFLFSTATIPVKAMHKPLMDALTGKGFEVVGEFATKGYMDYSFTKFFGGMNKGRPNEEDLQKAREFAKSFK